MADYLSKRGAPYIEGTNRYIRRLATRSTCYIQDPKPIKMSGFDERVHDIRRLTTKLHEQRDARLAERIRLLPKERITVEEWKQSHDDEESKRARIKAWKELKHQVNTARQDRLIRRSIAPCPTCDGPLTITLNPEARQRKPTIWHAIAICHVCDETYESTYMYRRANDTDFEVLP